MSEGAKHAVDFQPGQVVLRLIPLVGTMGRTEVEFAAAILVRVCQVRGAWGPVAFKEVVTVLNADVETNNEHARTWLQPIVKPDFRDLVARGFARWLGEPFTSALAFTDEGLAAMARWVKPREADGGRYCDAHDRQAAALAKLEVRDGQ